MVQTRNNSNKATRSAPAREEIRRRRDNKENECPTPTPSTQDKDILDRLEKLEAENKQLRARQHEASICGEQESAIEYERKNTKPEKESVPDGTIPRPRGSAGHNFSIQVEMGLAGSEKKKRAYQGIVRLVKEFSTRGNLNWELPWRDIAMDKKLKVFQLARAKVPFLKRFRNDWATEEILKQYFKNRRSYSYQNGHMEPPEKYAYLKKNAQKRSVDGSRVKKAKAVQIANKKRKLSSGSRKRRAEYPFDDDGAAPEAYGCDASTMDIDGDD